MENTAAVFEFLNKHDNSMVKLANTKIPNNPPTILKIIPAPMLILKMQLNQYVCADAPNPPKVATAPCSIYMCQITGSPDGAPAPLAPFKEPTQI